MSTAHPVFDNVRSKPYSSVNKLPFHTKQGDRKTPALVSAEAAIICPIKWSTHGVTSDLSKEGDVKFAMKR